jgi:predicted nucleic acid-binding protein
MQLVLDASAALYVAATRLGFSGLRSYELIAPPLFWSETLSGLHQQLHRRGISRELAMASLGALREAHIERIEPPDLRTRAWQIAEDLGWAKTYDAEYVALAEIAGARLLTRDDRMMRSGAGRIVTLVGPMDL